MSAASERHFPDEDPKGQEPPRLRLAKDAEGPALPDSGNGSAGTDSFEDMFGAFEVESDADAGEISSASGPEGDELTVEFDFEEDHAHLVRPTEVIPQESMEVSDSQETPHVVPEVPTAQPAPDTIRERATVIAEGNATAEGVPVVTARTSSKEGAELGKLLRATNLIPEPEEDGPLPAMPSRTRSILRWAAVAIMATGAAGGTWWGTTPVSLVRGTLDVSNVHEPRLLLTADGVSALAVARLKEKAPDVTPGELADETALRHWIELSYERGGMLMLEINGERAQAERVRALLTAAAQRGVSAGASASNVDALKEALRTAEEALTRSMARLAELEANARNSEHLAVVMSEVSALQKKQEVIAAKLESAKTASPATDDGARQKLDEALVSFQKQLETTKAQPATDERVTAFVSAVQNVQEQGAKLTEEILARHTEQGERLQMLKKRLDERMRIRQQQAWDGDEQLKRLTDQLAELKQRLASTSAAEKTKVQDLTGEIEYVQGLVSSRKLLIGSDRGDQRALAEVQSIIEEQAQAAEEDRKRLSESFEQMRQTLAKAMPEAGSVPDMQRQLATDLDARLSELQTARAAWAQASATESAKHEAAITALEAELAVTEKALIDRGKILEEAKSGVPSSAQLTEAKSAVEQAKTKRDAAANAVAAVRTSPSGPEVLTPEVTIIPGNANAQIGYTLAVGLTALLLGTRLTRYQPPLV